MMWYILGAGALLLKGSDLRTGSRGSRYLWSTSLPDKAPVVNYW
jgi:hypothetical protein